MFSAFKYAVKECTLACLTSKNLIHLCSTFTGTFINVILLMYYITFIIVMSCTLHYYKLFHSGICASFCVNAPFVSFSRIIIISFSIFHFEYGECLLVISCTAYRAIADGAVVYRSWPI